MAQSLKDWIIEFDNYLFENNFTKHKYLYKYITEEEFKEPNLKSDIQIYEKLIFAFWFWLSNKDEEREHYHYFNSNCKVEHLKPQNETEKKFIDIYVALKQAEKEINKELKNKYKDEFNNYMISL